MYSIYSLYSTVQIMCYSAESSITNYVLVSLMCGILYCIGDKYDKHFSTFMFIAVHMQLAEYFMWKDQKCILGYNKIATIGAFLLLLLQCISVPILGNVFRTTTLNPDWVYIVCAIISVPWIIAIVHYVIQHNDNICSVNRNGFLHWHWQYERLSIPYFLYWFMMLSYFGLMFLSWLYLKNEKRGYFLFIISFSSFLLHYLQFPKPDQWTTMWCFYIYATIGIYGTVRVIDSWGLQGNLM